MQIIDPAFVELALSAIAVSGVVAGGAILLLELFLRE